MMKIKRCFALLLCIVMMLSFNFTVMPAFADNNPSDYKLYTLNIFSNVCDITSSEIYEHDGKFYMSIENIAVLTRFSLTTDTDFYGDSSEAFALTQGSRIIHIQKETGRLNDDVYIIDSFGSYTYPIESTDVLFLMLDSQYYYECIPLLTYLGAECRVSELGGLTVTMPSYTLWEAIIPDMEKYWRDTNVTNEPVRYKINNVRVDIANDMLGDIWSIPSKLEAFSDAWQAEESAYMDGVYLNQALYEILDVNVMSFDSVKKEIGKNTQETNRFLEHFIGGADAGIDAYSILENYKIVSSDVINTDLLGKGWDIAKAHIDVGIAVEKRLNYDENTRTCFSSVLNDDVMESINSWGYDKASFEQHKNELQKNKPAWIANLYDDWEFADIGYSPSWKNEALELSEILSSDEKIAEATLKEKYQEEFGTLAKEKGTEMVANLLLGKGAGDLLVFEYSMLTDTILKDSFEASKSSIYAYCLNEMQYDILDLLYVQSNDAICEDCKDIDKLEIMKDMIALYYRTTIAFCQNNAKTLEEYHVGKTEREQLVAYYNQVAETLAVYLYKITNCTVSEIPDYNELSDFIMTEEWLNTTTKQNTENLFEILPQEFIFSSGAGAWGTSITIANDGTFVGEYHDSNMGDSNVSYPNGTVYSCSFKGKFSEPMPIDEYTYSMKTIAFETEDNVGSEYIENGIRYVNSEPYGFENINEFILYLPGSKLTNMQNEFECPNISNMLSIGRETLPEGMYVIYNKTCQSDFWGHDENSIWGTTYYYTYESTHSQFTPNTMNVSRITFWPDNNSPASLNICFNWTNDEQREFYATDSYGSENYNYKISVDFNEEKNEAYIELVSMNESDLTPYGGTMNGVLKATYNIDEPDISDENTAEPTEFESSVSDAKAHGTFANNLKWELSVDGILTITGEGDMPEYKRDEGPWKSYSDSIYEIQIGNGITRIGSQAFCELENLRKVVMASSVASIGSNAFDECESLSDVQFSENIIRVGSKAFSDTAWYDNQPSGKMIYIGKVAYFYKSKRFINVTKISGESGSSISGYYDSVSNITIRNGTVSIADNAFEECPGLLSVNIPDTVTHIGTAAFSWCVELTSIVIPSSVTELSENAFTCCTGLEEVSLSPGITKIAGAAFYGCRNIKTLTIPNTVTSIGTYAFTFCDSLENLYIPSSVTTIEDYAFYKCNSDMIIHCATGSYTETYANQKGYTYIADYQ